MADDHLLCYVPDEYVAFYKPLNNLNRNMTIIMLFCANNKTSKKINTKEIMRLKKEKNTQTMAVGI